MSTLINTENPDIMWEDWKTKFLAVADIHAPYITRKVGMTICALDYGRNKTKTECILIEIPLRKKLLKLGLNMHMKRTKEPGMMSIK
jgi:hypothetical protein